LLVWAIATSMQDMHPHDKPIVVIGASAGRIKALQSLVAEVPADFDGTIFVVTHIGTNQSFLPAILARATPLTVSHATDREHFEPGHIYVAPPDFHMLVHRTSIELSHGPRENHSRPAIDPLFRSAARAHGPRVAGVILSGALSDGVAGLLAVKARGGTAIVQDPDEALIESMPLSALRSVEADYVLPAADIGRLLATVGAPPPREEKPVDETVDDVARIREDFAEQEQDERAGELTMFTCPDCGGTLWQSGSGEYLGFRCHVGHTWGSEALLGHKSEEIEAALWSSVRLFEERASLSRQVAARLRQSGREGHRANVIDEGATRDEQHADAIRQLLSQPFNPTADDPAFDVEAEIAD
jgi:two-component system chemotaxis response regulator CheB